MRLAVFSLAAALLALQSSGSAVAQPPPAPVFLPNVKASVHFNTAGKPTAGWNEPSGIAGSDGAIYAAAQAPSSVDKSIDGKAWADPNNAYAKFIANRPDGDFGDVTMAADNGGTVFLGHLNGNLQAVIDYTRDGGQTWATADVPFGGSSKQPFLVDRPWIASYSPDADFHHTKVYVEYHDFVPSVIWVVTCDMASGSLICGPSQAVVSPPDVCDTIPGGVAVSPPGAPHAGRIYASWITADPATNIASGCNETQLAPFYALYAAYSDDGTNWTTKLVYQGPTGDSNCPHTTVAAGAGVQTCTDMSEIFTQIAVDGGDNAYISFVSYDSRLGTNYNVYLARSLDGGNTWDGSTSGTGLPFTVSSLTGRHWFPAIVAGDAGRIAVLYIRTPAETGPFMNNATCPDVSIPACDGKPKPIPATAPWYTYLAESTDANAAAGPTFTEVRVSDPGVAIHYGDNCNLGIYCSVTHGNRTLLDAISVFTDRAGYLQALWTDQREDPNEQKDNEGSGTRRFDQVYYACQTAGTPLYAEPRGPSICGPNPLSALLAREDVRQPFTVGPPHPLPALPLALVALGALAGGSALLVARRRKSRR
jgi:hypothetical protein